MSNTSRLLITLMLTSFVVGDAMAATRKQAVDASMAYGSGWSDFQSYDDPAPGDRAKGSIH